MQWRVRLLDGAEIHVAAPLGSMTIMAVERHYGQTWRQLQIDEHGNDIGVPHEAYLFGLYTAIGRMRPPPKLWSSFGDFVADVDDFDLIDAATDDEADPLGG